MSSEKFTFKDKLKLLLGLPEVEARDRFLKKWESFEKDCGRYAKAWTEENNLDYNKLCQISKACYNDELNCNNCPFDHTYGSCLDAIDMLIDYLEASRDHWLACGDLGEMEEKTMPKVQVEHLPDEITIVLGMWTKAAESVGARVEIYVEDGEQYLGINKPELWSKVVEAFKSFAGEEEIEFVEDPDYAEDYD